MIVVGRETFKKTITDPETIEKISKENQKLINLFIKEKSRSCSEKTIVVYKSELNIFFCWNVLYNNNTYYPDIKKYELSDFFDFLVNELKIQGKRFSHYRSVLSSFSDVYIKFLDDERPTFKNIINTMIEPIPKDDIREKTILDDEDVDKLFDIFKKEKRTQEACFLALALYGGARIAELLQYKVNMIDENRTAYGGVMLQSTEKLRTKGRGKQGKVMYKYIIKDLFLPYFKEWVKEREKKINELGVEDHGYLFLKADGGPATEHVVRRWMDKWTDIIGKPCYAHMCRHYYVTMLMTKYKLNKDFVTSTVGWSSDLTGIYCDAEDSDMEWEDAQRLAEMLKNN